MESGVRWSALWGRETQEIRTDAQESIPEAQIIAAQWQAEGGIPVAELCRKLEVTESARYRRKRQYAGLAVSK